MFRCSVIQSSLTLCDPMDSPVSSVHGIFPARILEWVAFSFFRGSFPTQGLNPGLLHWQADSLPLCYLGSPRWVEEMALNFFFTKIILKILTIGL